MNTALSTYGVLGVKIDVSLLISGDRGSRDNTESQPPSEKCAFLLHYGPCQAFPIPRCPFVFRMYLNTASHTGHQGARRV